MDGRMSGDFYSISAINSLKSVEYLFGIYG